MNKAACRSLIPMLSRRMIAIPIAKSRNLAIVAHIDHAANYAADVMA
jgi:hypothetical protein